MTGCEGLVRADPASSMPEARADPHDPLRHWRGCRRTCRGRTVPFGCVRWLESNVASARAEDRLGRRFGAYSGTYRAALGGMWRMRGRSVTSRTLAPSGGIAAEAVDPAEREIVRAVERDEGQPLAGRSAAERKRSAPARAGDDSVRYRQAWSISDRAGPGAASEPRREPDSPAGRRNSNAIGATGGQALEVGRERAECECVVAQRDFDRSSPQDCRASSLTVPIPFEAREPHSTASNTWTTALVHTPPWVSTMPRRSERVAAARRRSSDLRAGAGPSSPARRRSRRGRRPVRAVRRRG